jgi:hypothetical protein
MYYINANLPAPQAAFTGADPRPRWTSSRIHSHISNNTVLKNQDVGSIWNMSFSGKKTWGGAFIQAAYNYGESKNTVDPGSIAFGSWSSNPMSGDPNNPGLSYSTYSPGHRFYVSANYRKEYFSFGATAFSVFWETRTIGNTSYIFSGDINGDGSTSNDLLYIHRNTSEMNFQDIPGFTAAQQAAAWDAYIGQDAYLSQHRGEYAVRNAVFLPQVKRMDLSVSQDVFKDFGSTRQRFQFRVDIINFGNLLNSNWGVAQRLVSNSPLIVPTAAQGGAFDAQGRMQYRMRVVNGQLMNTSLQQTADLLDVYKVMLSFKYFFN